MEPRSIGPEFRDPFLTRFCGICNLLAIELRWSFTETGDFRNRGRSFWWVSTYPRNRSPEVPNNIISDFFLRFWEAPNNLHVCTYTYEYVCVWILFTQSKSCAPLDILPYVSHTYMQALFWVGIMFLLAVGETIKPQRTHRTRPTQSKLSSERRLRSRRCCFDETMTTALHTVQL